MKQETENLTLESPEPVANVETRAVGSSAWLGSVSASERRKEKSRMRMREKRKDAGFRKKDRERTKEWLKTVQGKASKKKSDIRQSRRRGHVEQTPELNRAIASKYLHNPLVREKTRAIALAKKENHHHARVWSLISPDGRTFRAKNLGAFIRDNMGLFDEHTWGNRGWESIYEALCQLSPRRINAKCVIFGWRWYIDGKHHDTLLSVLPNV